jgi:predicted nucleotidyltransferase
MRKNLIDALFPKNRQAILVAFLLQPNKWWYLSDLANFLKLTPSSLQRELASLAAVQLLEMRKEGNRVYYKANLLCPGIEELQSLLIKTAGIVDILKAGLKIFSKDIKGAFIYGSLARNEAIATSDVDLMVIGDLKLAQIATVIRKAEQSLRREINVTIYSPSDLKHKFKEQDGFIKTVLRDKKIFLKGSEHELKDLVRQG